MSKYNDMLPVKSKIEKIIDIKPSTNKDKKYDAFIENNDTKRIRVIRFGYRPMEQFKDRIGHYKSKDNNDPERRKNYIARHSVNPDFKEGKLTANYLSRVFLW